jgi:hypothetical protein
MIVRRCTAADQAAWDDFVRTSKNGLFLFERGYMDYHAERFSDHSLLDHLINDVYANKCYFDFGPSHEPADDELNVGLIGQKEAFGGRALVSDLYRVRI